MPYISHKPLPASKLRSLMAMGPDELVRVYTRQDAIAIHNARERGYLTGSHNSSEDNEDFGYQYEWMRQAMASRIPDFSGDLPVWAWMKRQNERKWIKSWRKEDRKTTPIMPRVIALVPRKRVLLSCYELWHHHLNNWYIPKDKDDYEAHDAKWPRYYGPGANNEYQQEVEKNWNTVFDVDQKRSEFLVKEFVGQVAVIQACVDRIYLDEIVSIRWLC